jgi:predicted phosphodiesterase
VRYLVLSDLHANWYALEAVLGAAQGRYEQVVCCGDLVGYNAHPAQIIDWVRVNCGTTVRGNHDKVVAGIDDLEWFNDVAQAAARWTMLHLEESDLAFLRNLPEGPAKLDHFHIWHGSPADEDEYVTAPREAATSFAHFDLPLAFFGHTHVQGGFFSKHGRVGSLSRGRPGGHEHVIELEPDTLYLVNPGSVGQPRDGDPRAAYAFFDSEQNLVTLCRAEYPVEKTAAEIDSAGLPGVLGLRLFHGF